MKFTKQNGVKRETSVGLNGLFVDYQVWQRFHAQFWFSYLIYDLVLVVEIFFGFGIVSPCPDHLYLPAIIDLSQHVVSCSS